MVAAAQRRYEVLDSLRGLCACIVALFHFHTAGAITNLSIVSHGWLFVDFFFVLSGFVIASAYFRRLSDGFSPWRFLALRLGRIYPLHLFVLLILLAMELLLASGYASFLAGREPFTGRRTPEGLLATSVLANAFGLLDGLSWNGPSWSIGAEFWTYCLFAALVGIAGRRALPLFALAGAAALLLIAARSQTWLNVTYDLGFLRCVFGFSLGVLLHPLAARTAPPGSRWTATALELALCALCILFVSFVAEGPWSLAGPPLFALMVLVFAFEAGHVSDLLKRGPMLLLGALSYSIYMLHSFVQGRFADGLQLLGVITGETYLIPARSNLPGEWDRVVVPGVGSDLLTLLMMAILIGLSWLTYRFVETPGREWTRRLLMPGRGKAPALAEAKAPTF